MHHPKTIHYTTIYLNFGVPINGACLKMCDFKADIEYVVVTHDTP